MNLRLHIVNGIRGLHLKGDGLSSQGLHKNLHATRDVRYGRLRVDVTNVLDLKEEERGNEYPIQSTERSNEHTKGLGE